MKKFYGKEEKRIEKLEPKVEIPPELETKEKIHGKVNIKKYLQSHMVCDITFR